MAVVEPGTDYAPALAARGHTPVAVATEPAPAKGAHPAGTRAQAVTHRGSLRRTAARLRDLRVDGVLAGSTRGIVLAEQVASRLGLPADPATVGQRSDRGIQHRALQVAGIPAPAGCRTDRLAEATAWWRACKPAAAVLLPTAVGAPAAPVVCQTSIDIAHAWPAVRRAAHLHSGSADVVVSEYLPGRRYTVHSTTRPAAGGRAADHRVTDLWADSYTWDGILARSELLPRHGLLARTLALYALQVLDVLGVQAGPMVCRLAFAPGRGPLLLSAAPVLVSTPADAALYAATGTDRLTSAVTSLLPEAPDPLRAMHRGQRVVRVHLHAAADSVLAPVLWGTLTQLPTVVATSPHLRAGAQARQTASSRTTAGEVVLSHRQMQAVDSDYQTIRLLEATGLYAPVPAGVPTGGAR
ncbi:hypothetical protein GCM10010358_70960 [Streptomyces minutiscleroticus]|uniref:ATP-grasp domain-containing protein n=1 Tax=Streptomyces minutiscleroticus TaxID=68238 RepID=A0A918NZQ1_9ACTN|nr:hypothetical protein GCM10010358_70960 [Streptomyces minutiscleroticus]